MNQEDRIVNNSFRNFENQNSFYLENINLQGKISDIIIRIKNIIEEKDIQFIYTLNLNNTGLSSIPDLGIRIKVIFFQKNKLRDLKSFHDTNVEQIYISDNLLENVDNLKNLKKLKELDLSDNTNVGIDFSDKFISYETNIQNSNSRRNSNLTSSVNDGMSSSINRTCCNQHILQFHLPLLTYLNISNIGLRQLPVNLFNFFPIIRRLNLSSNTFEDINNNQDIVNTFFSNEKLVELGISNIGLTFFPRLNNISQHLDISKNNIGPFLEGNNLFDFIPLNIESLNLSEINLTIFPDFSIFTNLQTLDISKNRILNTNNIGSNLPNTLQYLNLSSIGLQDFPNLANLDNLLELDLSTNNLTSINVIYLPQNITKLVFSDMNINEFNIVGNKITVLEELNISHVNISAINISIISSVFPMLQILDISNNSISEIDIGSTLETHIETLDISRNDALKIPRHSFNTKPNFTLIATKNQITNQNEINTYRLISSDGKDIFPKLYTQETKNT